MSTRTRSFLHDSFVVPAVLPTLGTAFSTADVHVHNMELALPLINQKGDFQGIVEGIHLRLTDIAGGATKVTIRVCLDAALDISIVPDTTAELAFGVTTAASGCAAFKVGIPIFQILTGSTLYLAAFVDAGSASMAASCITWRE